MKKNHILFASIFGNVLEFYDFTLFGIFAVTIAKTYFPPSSSTGALLQSLSVFGAGFLMRPLGAIVFGYIGDKLGRKKALTLSIAFMGFPTLLIGLMPTYTQIGIFAPIIIMLCRLIQGLCTGGEYNGAAVFALEHIGNQRAGLTGGFICGSAGLGALAALGVSALTSLEMMPSWSWRMAFVLGALGSLYGWHIRRNMMESPAFKKLKDQDSLVENLPLIAVLKKQKLSVLSTLCLGLLDGLLSYVVFVFFQVYLESQLSFTLQKASLYSLVGTLIFTVFSPIFGRVCDAFNKPKTYFMTYLVALCLCALPLFSLLPKGGAIHVMGTIIIVSLLAAAVAGPIHAYCQNIFPANSRYSGISFSYSIGISIGGFTPFIFALLMTKKQGTAYMGLYLFLWAVISLFVVGKNKNTRISKA
jgi:MHS family proline/betaine transporter-like MFS transporter